MEKPSFSLLMTRRDPSRNMARFYSLSIGESLFGDVCLIRDWGRIGTRGRRIVELHRSVAAAEQRLQTVASAKMRRGYCAVST